MHSTNHTHERNAISMVEVVVSTALVGMVLAVSVQTVASVASARGRTKELRIGPLLASELLNEVLASAYQDPDEAGEYIGPDAGEGTANRLDFDDIDDFHGWDSAAPVTADGTPLTIGAGWSRQINVEFVDPTTLTPVSAESGLKRVTVVVTSPSSQTTELQALRSNIGATQRPPHADKSIVAGATVSIALDSNGHTSVRKAFVKNHATDE